MSLFKVILAAAATTSLVGCIDSLVSSTGQQEGGEQAISVELKQATARYNDINNALADGYVLGYHGAAAGCVAKPGTGAMGYHYFLWTRMDDPSIIEDQPEVLVYHTDPDTGELALGAVEWVVPKAKWEAAGNTAPPEVFGQQLHVINPVLNWYVEHAWVWTPNPAGIFQDWNPDVTCP